MTILWVPAVIPSNFIPITDEDPGADLASYPLNQVPEEAATIVRALLTADKNQHFARSRMSAEECARQPIFDFRPFIIADADNEQFAGLGLPFGHSE